MNRFAIRFAVVLAVPLAGAPPAQAGPQTTSFAVSGQVATPTTFNAAGLALLPQTTRTVSYLAGSTPVTDTFTGPLIWSVLQGAGGIPATPGISNDVLRNYIVGTGSDGYAAVYSAGELAPTFGNKPYIVATSDANNTLPAPDGFACTIATGDVRGGRYVSNLAGLDVRRAPVAQPSLGGGRSTQFSVTGAVSTSLTFDLAALQALTPHTTTVTYLSGSTPVTDTYTGALLWDVLGLANVLVDPLQKNDILQKVVTATGTDGYEVAFALGEIAPSFGNAPILVAYDDALGQISGGAGFARLVVPGDVRGGRYLSNLSNLLVFDGVDVPEPASVVLLAVALILLAVSRLGVPPLASARARAG